MALRLFRTASVSIGLVVVIVVLMALVRYVRRPSEYTPAAVRMARPVATVPLYETFELELRTGDTQGNPFAAFPRVTFTHGSHVYRVEGFFDGGPDADLWRVRFVPETEGLWQFHWYFLGADSAGTFEVGPRDNPFNHGHVHRDGRFLQHADETTLQWRAANWVQSEFLRPRSAWHEGESWDEPLTDQLFLAYLDRLVSTGHNGNTIMGMERPMNDDRRSFDIDWLSRLDWAIAESGRRGLYTILGLFDTWGRPEAGALGDAMASEEQLLSPWQNRYMESKHLYLRYIVARYSGYYNVLWEIGNEMEHKPNDANAFVKLANAYYLPWIRAADPYDLPITVSEEIWRRLDVSVGGLHQAEAIAIDETRPCIHTEIVRAGGTLPLWQSAAYADPLNRPIYRHVAWRAFAEGGSGAIECTALADEPSLFPGMRALLHDTNVRNVMEDRGRFATFLETLPADRRALVPLGSGIGESSLTPYRSRGESGMQYVAYFDGHVEGGVRLALDVPEGSYAARWFSPATGMFSVLDTVAVGDTLVSPWPGEYDAALHVVRVATGD